VWTFFLKKSEKNAIIYHTIHLPPKTDAKLKEGG